MSGPPTSSDNPQQLLNGAVAALRNGEPAQAAQLAARAIQAGFDNASSWGVLAIASRDAQQLDQALQAADRSIAHEGRNPRAYVVKGDVFFQRHDPRAAAAFYRQALSFGPVPENAPTDLRTDMTRAQTRVNELQGAFARHLARHVDDLLARDGDTTDRMREAVDLLMGKRKLYYPEPHHLMFPGLPVRAFYPNEMFEWLPALEAATDDIRGELDVLLANNAAFDAYLDAGEHEQRPLFDTHGMAGNSDWGAFYLWRNGEPVPENQARCPLTTEVVSRLPLVHSGQRCPTVFFSRLKAGTTIPPHTGMINTRLIGHLPLIVPDQCGFRVGNDVRQWEPGKAWLFDDTIEHEAWNHSNKDRLILIFEVWKPELTEAEQQLVTRMLEAVDSYAAG